MQQDGEEYPQARQRPLVCVGRAHLHAGAQGDPFGHGMHPQAEDDANQAARMDNGIAVVAAVVEVLRLGAEVVLMVLKDAQQENHHDHAEDHPSNHFLDDCGPGKTVEAVGQKVKHGDAEDEAGDETHYDLGAGMGHGAQARQFSAAEGDGKDAGAVGEQNQKSIRIHDG